MRTVPVKEKIVSRLFKKKDVNGEETDDTYDPLKVMRDVVARPNGGTNYGDMALAVKVINKLDEAKATAADAVLLENNEFDHLCDKLRNFQFGAADPALFGWMQGLFDLPDEPLKKDG